MVHLKHICLHELPYCYELDHIDKFCHSFSTFCFVSTFVKF